MLVPVLLSGGRGARLWPLSREASPKQYVNVLTADGSPLQKTIERLGEITVDHAGWIVVANANHKALLSAQLSKFDAKINKVVLEPFGRNTAPAIALAAIEALKISSDAVLLVQPADHFIPDSSYFCSCVELALKSKKDFITFGVSPTRPETGFGYIEMGDHQDKAGLFNVNCFLEKPSSTKAKKLLKTGKYAWNSGIFLLNARRYIEELTALSPEIVLSCEESLDNAKIDGKFVCVSSEVFQSCPSVSIDVAFMEKNKGVFVMPFNSHWSDLGAWDTVLEDLPVNDLPIDKQDNLAIGDGVFVQSQNTLIKSSGRLVAAVGVKNLIIVETSDAVLVVSKGNTQSVKSLVDNLYKTGRTEVESHGRVQKPWGYFESFCKDKNSQVKKIFVEPGKSLSLQSHKHRSEHWVVVQGVAQVVNGQEMFELMEGQTTFIPLGTKHRLSNSGSLDLIIIEVQIGSYLGEDDIVRFEDDYGRV